MWPFGRREPDPELAERVRDLERKMAVVDVEWSDWFDRYRRLYAKISKRAQEVPEDQPEGDRGANGQPGASFPGEDPSALHPHPTNPQLLLRRRSLRGF